MEKKTQYKKRDCAKTLLEYGERILKRKLNMVILL